MTSFLEYYRDELAKRTPVATRSAAPVASSGITLGGGDASAPAEDVNPVEGGLRWALDMISRPLYGVVNATRKGMDQGVQGIDRIQHGDAGGIGDVLAGLPTLPSFMSPGAFSIPNAVKGALGNNVDENFTEALLNPSNDPTLKQSNSDLLEHAADLVGVRSDPNYKDEENNFNPIAKGVLGLGLDIAADPLTFLPGPSIAAVGSGLARGVRAVGLGRRAGEAASEAAPATAVAEAVADAVKVPDRVPAGIEENAFEGAAPKPGAQMEIPSFVKPTEKVADTTPDNPFEMPAPIRSTDEIAPTAEAAALPEVPLVTPHAGPKVDAAGEAVVEVLTKQKTVAQTIKDSPKIPGMRAEIRSLFDELKAAPTEPISMNEFVKTSDQIANVALPGDAITKNYTMQQLGKIVATNKKVNPARAGAAFAAMKQAHTMFVESRATAITDSLQAFSLRIANGERAMRATLGDGLVDHLSQITSPRSMTQTLTTLDRLLGGAVDPEKLAARSSGGQALVEGVQGALRGAEQAVPAQAAGEAEAAATELSEVSEMFRQTVRQEMLPGTPEFKAKYLPGSGKNPIRFTSTDVDERLARWWRKGNTQFQYTLFGKLADDVFNRRVVEATGQALTELKGKPNAAAFREAVASTGDDITRAMETFGIPVHLGTADDMVRLTFPQMYDAINAAMVALHGDDAALLALYNGGSRVAFTRLADVLYAHLVNEGGLSLDEISSLLREPMKAGARGSQRLPNNITSGSGRGWYNPAKTVTPQMQAMADQLGATWVKGTKQGFQLTFGAESRLPEMLAQAIFESKIPLTQLAEKNAADWAARGISEATELSDQVLGRLNELAANPTMAAQRELALRTHNVSKDVAAAAADIAATGEGTIAADVLAATTVGETAARQVEATVTHAEDLAAGMDPVEAAHKELDKMMAAMEDDIAAQRETFEEIAESRIVPETVDPEVAEAYLLGGGKTQAEIVATRNAMFGGVGRSLGVRMGRNYGAETLGELREAAEVLKGGILAERVFEPLRLMTKKYLPEEITQALKAVQNDTRVVGGSLAGAKADMEKIIGSLFETTPGVRSALGNIFTDTVTHIEHLNDTLRWAFQNRKGLAPQFDMATARDMAKAANATKRPTSAQISEQLKEQWRRWDLGEDTIGGVAALGQAALRSAEHRSLVASFVRTGTRDGWGVKVAEGQRPPAGFVRIADGGDSVLGKIVPNDFFVNKALAKEIDMVDFALRASKRPTGEFGDFVSATVVPITQTWKALMLMRPGYHIRNGLGNVFAQYVRRGSRDFTKSWQSTLRVMSIAKMDDGLDSIAALNMLGDHIIPSAGEALVKGGKYGEVTADTLYAAALRRGLFPKFATAQGLDAEVVETALSRGARAVSLQDTGLGRLHASVATQMDHYQRMHHLIQIVMQESAGRGRWNVKSFNEMIELAVNEVKRLHPDSSMNTVWDNKWGRIAVPFYTWMKNVLPFMVQSALEHPGRISGINKVSYNSAVAAGINPDSLSDPFPEDQMFPSFIRSSMFGPQLQVGGAYLRVNPGVPQADIANSFQGGIIPGLLGMTNPLARVPLELASGGSWSGVPINDGSDYLDASIPGVNLLSNLTGTSITGSPASLLAGQGLDPQAQVEAGNKTDFDKALSALNWLTGLGIQNVSKPNLVNYAEIEKRNRESGNGGSSW